MIKISIRDESDSLYSVYVDGKNSVKNRKKNPYLSNPYLDGSKHYVAFEKGVKEQKDLEKLISPELSHPHNANI
jgi:hypothetical protein